MAPATASIATLPRSLRQRFRVVQLFLQILEQRLRSAENYSLPAPRTRARLSWDLAAKLPPAHRFPQAFRAGRQRPESVRLAGTKVALSASRILPERHRNIPAQARRLASPPHHSRESSLPVAH